MNYMTVFEDGSPVPAEGNMDAALRRAYIEGAYDAMRRQSAEQDGSFKTALAAMGFGFLCWAAMMYFLFK